MSGRSKSADEIFTPLQTAVFSRWVLVELRGKTESNFKDITKDLSNGVVLVELAHVLTKRKASENWYHNPKTPEENFKNCEIAFQMFRMDGFKVAGITPKDFSENNERHIVRYIWKLILHYTIFRAFGDLSIPEYENVSEANIKSKLLAWGVQRTQSYKNVFDFRPYDLGMCALLDSYYPNKIDYYVLDLKEHDQIFKLVIETMNDLKIPCLIYPEDVSENDGLVDQKTLLTQLALTRMVLENEPNKIKSNAQIDMDIAKANNLA